MPVSITRFTIVAITSLVFALPTCGQKQQIPNELYRIRKIFIRTQRSFETDPSASTHLGPLMKQTLETYRFVVVTDAADADALLDGEVDASICFDCYDRTPWDKQEFYYVYTLKSQAGTLVWQNEIKARAHSKLDADRIGLQKVARSLFAAWKKTATKAGITVGDRLP
jgi:hypothetical protein